MKVLLTGANGWIASALKVQLCNLAAIDETHTNTPTKEIIKKAMEATVVIHASGVYSDSRPDSILGNIPQAAAIARGCCQCRNTVVFLSSTKVYGWGWAESHNVSEKESGRNVCAFGRMKKLLEGIFNLAAMRSVILRISNVYGNGIPECYTVGAMLQSSGEKRSNHGYLRRFK